MKTAAAYIRVSTNGQLEYSPDSQLRCIRDYALKNGYDLPERYIYREEDGVSGRGAKKRTEFQRMIAEATRRPRPFDCVLLWKFSRFARSRADSVLYKSLLRRHGIEVISVSEPLGGDKTSILVEAMIEAMDEYYSLNLAEEVRRGMREKAARGEPVTAPPFGYRMVEKHFVPAPEEAAAVRQIYLDWTGGTPAAAIAEKLNAAGLRTRRGGQWESRAVRYLLKNPAYRGALRWNPCGALGRGAQGGKALIRENCHEPIVTERLWNAAQERFRPGNARSRGTPSHGMLQGLVFCSDCGAPLVFSSSGGMQCSGYAHGTCCVSHWISIRKLESMVIAFLKSDLQATELNLPAAGEESEKKSLLAGRLSKERKRLNRLREAYLDGTEPLTDYARERGEIERSCRSVQEELKKSPETRFRPGKLDLISLLCGGDLSPQQKNVLLRSLIQKIVFDRKRGRLLFYYR